MTGFFDSLAFPLLGGRCPRRGRMRVGIVGAETIERADEDIRPYGRSLVGPIP